MTNSFVNFQNTSVLSMAGCTWEEDMREDEIQSCRKRFQILPAQLSVHFPKRQLCQMFQKHMSPTHFILRSIIPFIKENGTRMCCCTCHPNIQDALMGRSMSLRLV